MAVSTYRIRGNPGGCFYEWKLICDEHILTIVSTSDHWHPELKLINQSDAAQLVA